MFTSRCWREASGKLAHDQASRLHRLSVITTALVFIQLVLGAHIRHITPNMDPGLFRLAVIFHLVVAAVLAVHVALLLWRVLRHHRSERALTRPSWILLGLMLLQLTIGGATWLIRFSWPAWMRESYHFAASFLVPAGGGSPSTIVTTHVAIGSLILVVALTITLRGLRLVRPPAQSAMRQTAVGAVALGVAL